MRITIMPDEAAFDLEAAWRIVAGIVSKPDAVVGVSTGRTTIRMHQIVAEIHRAHPFDVTHTTVFGVDEIVHIERAYHGSCWARIDKELTGPIGIRPGNFLMPPTRADDFDAECRRFEAELAARGGADLQMLGIGENGHVGFNQPGTPFARRAWVAAMDPVLEERVRRETNTPADQALAGLTLGPWNLMRMRRVVLVAKGAHKADIIERAVGGPVTEDVPASILQLHPDCEVLLDADAASALSPATLGAVEAVRRG